MGISVQIPFGAPKERNGPYLEDPDKHGQPLLMGIVIQAQS